jgi:2-polyprenyl-3-methyl-5-hydroxy-6-metoxy-1,4-benzoquinol methylase
MQLKMAEMQSVEDSVTNENATMSDAKVKPLQWTDELVRKFWNYQSRTPENYFTSLYGDRIADAVCSCVPPRARILDYACGTGALTGHLLHAGFFVSACDLSPDSVAYVQNKYDKHPAFCGASRVNDMLAREAQFDAVVLVELVEHVDDSVLTRIMTDVYKILAPGGTVIVTTPNHENLDAETVFCPCCNHTFHRWQHVRSWSGRALAECLGTHGFKTVLINETDFSRSRKSGLIRYCLHRILQAFRRRKPPHLMVAAKKMPEGKVST